LMSRVRKSSVAALIVRVVIITILATLTTFAVALFLGIIGTVIAGLIRGSRPHMAGAYRHIALPVAVAAAVIAFVISLVTEIRHYRRSHTT